MPYYKAFDVVKEDTHIVEHPLRPDVFYDIVSSAFPNLLLISTLCLKQSIWLCPFIHT